ncbi:MAG: phenylalanine--tRNA ligase beta subunit-related protein [Anaerolineales bacterium]
MIILTENWRTTYPDAALGILVMGNVSNPQSHETLALHKEALERELRTRYAGYDRERFRTHPVLTSYHSYYKRFKKTYHVQLQLESIVFKGKALPQAAALVEAMFMAELKHLILTAGHDFDEVQLPVTLDVAEGHEHYVRLNGQEQELKAKDMMIVDALGVLSSIIYGPDQRTKIKPSTTRVLFTAYGTPGINPQDLREHIETIRQNVMVVSPEAEVELIEVYKASSQRLS